MQKSVNLYGPLGNEIIIAPKTFSFMNFETLKITVTFSKNIVPL
jgi:hypothetical protein